MKQGLSLVQARGRRWTVVSALLAVTAAACSGSGGTADPTPTTNTPPTIQSLVAGAPMVEVTGDQSVQLTATVIDAETSAAQLEYLWSALPATGTFIGTGPQVRWKATTTTPDATIMLTVVETYVSGATTKQNSVEKTLPVRYNDLIIGGLVSQFLTDFGTFSVGPAECVRNFSNSCPGKAMELSDVSNNRAQVHIQSAVFSISSVTLRPNGTSADIVAPCTFRDNLGTTTGNCLLTAVHESSRWLLCDSNYQFISSTSSSLALPSAKWIDPRFRAP